MAQERIEMSPAEWRAFLAEQGWMVLGTLEPDGAPWASLAHTLLEGEALCFAVPAGSRAARNLERDPRACCASDAFPSYYEIRGATVHGTAQPLRDPGLRRRLAQRIEQLPLPGWEADASPSIWSLPLRDVMSFDFARIRRRY